MSFTPPSDRKRTPGSGPDDPITADIFVRGSRFHIRGIPCRVVYDIIAPEDRPAYSVSASIRRCGLKFDSLTEDQEEQIKLFLKNHTIGAL